MDIKELNKSQLILLAVLLSFITSIATGITTVTLMQQAPVSFTAPVNRVVKQTIEKIQQVEGKTVTQTVVVKEEDLVVDAIDKNKSAVFSISVDGDYGPVSLGQGFVINNDGVIVVDGTSIKNKDQYFVENSSGKFKASFLFNDSKGGFSFLKIGEPLESGKVVAYTLPTFGDINTMKIGQKILVYGNSISSTIWNGDKDLRLSVSKSNSGGMVLDLDGGVIGIALASDSISFAPIKNIQDSFTLNNK